MVKGNSRNRSSQRLPWQGEPVGNGVGRNHGWREDDEGDDGDLDVAVRVAWKVGFIRFNVHFLAAVFYYWWHQLDPDF